MGMRYVVSVENIFNKKKSFCYASSSLNACKDYISRKHRGCKLATRSTDKENDPSVIEKYVHVFNKTMNKRVILIIRILHVELSDNYEEEYLNESTQEV